MMELDERTANLVREWPYEELEGLEKDRWLTYSSTNLGPWKVFTFTNPVPPHVRKPFLYWMGWTGLAVQDRLWALQAMKTLFLPHSESFLPIRSFNNMYVAALWLLDAFPRTLPCSAIYAAALSLLDCPMPRRSPTCSPSRMLLRALHPLHICR